MSRRNEGFYRFILMVWFALWFFFFAGMQTRGEEAAKPFAIRHVRVFDGECLIADATVVVESGRIAAMGKDIPIPPEAKVIEGAGKTLLPGLIDAHVHVYIPETLKQFPVFGVTTVVDMMSDPGIMAGFRKQQASGNAAETAYIISAGAAATPPGGHGTQYMKNVPIVKGPEEVAAFVDARIAEGSDFIKIIWEDGTLFGKPFPALDLPTVDALIRAAQKKEKMTVIHAATLRQAMGALEAGVSGLVHLPMDRADASGFGELASRKGAFVIPTLSVLEGLYGVSGSNDILNDPDLGPFISLNDRMGLNASFNLPASPETFELKKKQLRQLLAHRVPILAGTDAPNPGTCYGASLHHELLLLVQAGMKPLQALKSATSIPATLFGLKDRGVIRPGAVADLLLVEGDPTKEIKDSRVIVSVWRGGMRIDRDKVRDRIQAEKEKIAKLRDAPPPDNSASGWISDFETEPVASRFGAGWSESTDAYMGGKSRVLYRLVNGGAEGSAKSLSITGTVAEGSDYVWAGAMFSPGPAMMAPANLAFKKGIGFWAKGDGRDYVVTIFSQGLGYTPVSQTFTPGAEWKEFYFTFQSFGIEGFDVMGIFIGAWGGKGDFSLQIDNVCLK